MSIDGSALVDQIQLEKGLPLKDSVISIMRCRKQEVYDASYYAGGLANKNPGKRYLLRG